MTYTEALQYIHSVSWRGSVPGLSRIQALCDAMGNPERELRVVHVAGTNGKGSTVAYLSSILRAAGYRVGSFTSPYVRTFNERIAVDGKPVSNYMLASATETVRAYAEGLEDKPTEFELITAIGFEIFRRKKCDIVVLEVGLGGRFDSTNVVTKPLCSVITGIAMDHMQLLGDTLAKIAWEKAGIIKEGCPVVTAALAPEAERVIADEAAVHRAPRTVVDPAAIRVVSQSLAGIVLDYKGRTRLKTSLIGLYQPRNIALVCETVDVLRGIGIAIPEAAVRRGIAETRWQARFELLSRDPVVIYDGGHNEEGVRAAVDTVKAIFGGKVVLVSGVMRDKAYEKMVSILAEIADCAVTLTPDNPRALPAAEYAEVFRAHGIPAEPRDTIAAAVHTGVRAAEEKGEPLIILGSLYTYKDVYRLFQ